MRQIFNALAILTTVSTAAFAQTAAPAPANPLKPAIPPSLSAPATPAVSAPAVAKPAMPAVTTPAVAAPAKPAMPAATAPAATTEKALPKKAASEGQLAARDRQKQCGVEWKALKASGKQGEQKWPQFWSACNKRLKGA
jgi:hypothetical protein